MHSWHELLFVVLRVGIQSLPARPLLPHTAGQGGCPKPANREAFHPGRV